MAATLVTVSPPPQGVYRIARVGISPFAPPPWHLSHSDGTFGNRFDDPSAAMGQPQAERFRAVYSATHRVASFGETVARFRPSLSLLAQLSAIEDDEPITATLAGVADAEDPQRGIIPVDWRLRRCVGHSVLASDLVFVDIAAPATIQHLRTLLAPLADSLGLVDVDLSTLTSQQRRFTQGCARYLYDQLDAAGRPRFAGIRYLSRLNPNWECWAVFADRIRHAPGWPGPAAAIPEDDYDLITVAALFNLTIEVVSGQDEFIRP